MSSLRADPSVVVKFYVKVMIKRINFLFYKMKEEGACKKGRVESESGVCVGEVSVGGNS